MHKTKQERRPLDTQAYLQLAKRALAVMAKRVAMKRLDIAFIQGAYSVKDNFVRKGLEPVFLIKKIIKFIPLQ